MQCRCGALLETRWLGNRLYEVGGSVMVTSGRGAHVEGASVQKGEDIYDTSAMWTDIQYLKV